MEHPVYTLCVINREIFTCWTTSSTVEVWSSFFCANTLKGRQQKSDLRDNVLYTLIYHSIGKESQFSLSVEKNRQSITKPLTPAAAAS